MCVLIDLIELLSTSSGVGLQPSTQSGVGLALRVCILIELLSTSFTFLKPSVVLV